MGWGGGEMSQGRGRLQAVLDTSTRHTRRLTTTTTHSLPSLTRGSKKHGFGVKWYKIKVDGIGERKRKKKGK